MVICVHVSTLTEPPNEGRRNKDGVRVLFSLCFPCWSFNKQATEPYSDNLLNRTRSPSEPYLDKEISFRRALRDCFGFGFSTGNPPKTDTFTTRNRTQNLTWTPPENWSHARTIENCFWRFLTIFDLSVLRPSLKLVTNSGQLVAVSRWFLGD